MIEPKQTMIGNGQANSTDVTKEKESSLEGEGDSEVSQFKPSAKTPQIWIVDVFALLTIAALICALVVPILRVTHPEAKKIAAIVLVIQVVVTLVGAVLMFQRRSNSLKNAGARIGIGYRSEIKWKYWPEVFSILLLTLVAITSIGLSIALGFMLEQGHGRLIMFLFCILQSARFCLMASRRRRCFRRHAEVFGLPVNEYPRQVIPIPLD